MFRISQWNLTVELFLLLHFIITAPAMSSSDVGMARLLTLYIAKVSPESLNACKDFNINVISGLMYLQNRHLIMYCYVVIRLIAPCCLSESKNVCIFPAMVDECQHQDAQQTKRTICCLLSRIMDGRNLGNVILLVRLIWLPACLWKHGE